MRYVLCAFVFAAAFWTPRDAVAAPVTLNFSGAWRFYDPITDTDLLHNALAPFGVVDGTALSLSLTFDDTAIDSDSTSALGFYSGAILQTRLHVGSLTLDGRGGDVQVAAAQSCVGYPCPGEVISLAAVSGPSVSPFFAASRVQFNAFHDVQSDALSRGLGNVTGWSAPTALVYFQGTQAGYGTFLGTSQLTLQSVSVPEPGSFLLSLGALVAAIRVRRARPRG